ncbi:MAG: papain-like cysteine peptidase [Nitrospirota bacterium]|nr:papain-like cysteine peptidase [Nitrospirota bacterium]
MSHPDVINLLMGDRSRYEIIPLGTNCAPSHFLRAIGLRTTALPFDWNVTPVRTSIELIKNGFSDFFDIGNLIFLPPVFRLLFDEKGVELEMKNDIITPVVCRKYNMLFPHDLPEDYRKSIDDVKEKYSRRIARLTELLHSDRHLIFVHHDERLNDWQESQYMASLNRRFINPHATWKKDLSAVLDEQYPVPGYSLLELSEFRSIIEGFCR